jgi:hypothetical protein
MRAATAAAMHSLLPRTLMTSVLLIELLPVLPIRFSAVAGPTVFKPAHKRTASMTTTRAVVMVLIIFRVPSRLRSCPARQGSRAWAVEDVLNPISPGNSKGLPGTLILYNVNMDDDKNRASLVSHLWEEDCGWDQHQGEGCQ